MTVTCIADEISFVYYVMEEFPSPDRGNEHGYYLYCLINNYCQLPVNSANMYL